MSSDDLASRAPPAHPTGEPGGPPRAGRVVPADRGSGARVPAQHARSVVHRRPDARDCRCPRPRLLRLQRELRHRGQGRLLREFPNGACPIVGSYGAKDRVNRGSAKRLERVLTATGVDHDIREYPGAGHGFLNDHDPSDMPVLFAVMGRLSGTAFHEPSAQRGILHHLPQTVTARSLPAQVRRTARHLPQGAMEEPRQQLDIESASYGTAPAAQPPGEPPGQPGWAYSARSATALSPDRAGAGEDTAGAPPATEVRTPGPCGLSRGDLTVNLNSGEKRAG